MPGGSKFEGAPLTALIIATLLAAFAMDLATPRGVAVWVAYAVPVTLCALGARPMASYQVAALASLLTAVGYLLSPGVATEEVSSLSRVNRLAFMATVWALAVLAHRVVRNKLDARLRDWVREGRSRLVARLQGEQGAGELGDAIVSTLCEYVGAPVGVLYTRDGDGSFMRTAAYAAPVGMALPDVIRPGEGLVGQAVKERRVRAIDALPEH